MDLTIEDQSRLKVIYGSAEGFHAVDLDSATVYDIYLPKHVSTIAIASNRLHLYYSSLQLYCFINFLFQTQGPIIPHCIVALPNSNGTQLLLCYDNEGVYVNTVGRVSKNIVLQVCVCVRIVHLNLRALFLMFFFACYFQWGEMPTSVAYIGTGQIMGWGNKAIEVRTGQNIYISIASHRVFSNIFLFIPFSLLWKNSLRHIRFDRWRRVI